ncbi:MAG: hypothetical protein ACC618_00520 [Patescibacteria group bacterium]
MVKCERRKFDRRLNGFRSRVFWWFLLAGSAIALVMTRVHLGFIRFGISGGKAMYGFPISIPLDPPLNLTESLVVFVPNALVWALVPYFLFRLVKWVKNRYSR